MPPVMTEPSQDYLDDRQQPDAGPGAQAHLQSDPHARRYEFRPDGDLAGFIDYYRFGQTALVVHTEVQIQGKGYGSQLVRQALGYFRDEGLQVAPVCGFLAGYMRRYPEFADLTTAQSKRIFNL